MINQAKNYFIDVFSSFVKFRFNRFARHYEKAVSDAGYLEGELASVVDFVNKIPNLIELQVLELGCGQGFAGRLLRNKPKLLVGVDISRGMLDRIDSNSFYSELHCGEILNFFHSESRKFDLIFASSVAQFLNPTHLYQVAHQAHSHLSDSGEFVLTFDLRDSGGGKLNSKGFYEYSIPYLESLLSQIFDNVTIEELPFSRIERGKQVKSGIAVTRVTQTRKPAMQ